MILSEKKKKKKKQFSRSRPERSEHDNERKIIIFNEKKKKRSSSFGQRSDPNFSAVSAVIVDVAPENVPLALPKPILILQSIFHSFSFPFSRCHRPSIGTFFDSHFYSDSDPDKRKYAPQTLIPEFIQE